MFDGLLTTAELRRADSLRGFDPVSFLFRLFWFGWSGQLTVWQGLVVREALNWKTKAGESPTVHILLDSEGESVELLTSSLRRGHGGGADGGGGGSRSQWRSCFI